jgi:hypothetical protein
MFGYIEFDNCQFTKGLDGKPDALVIIESKLDESLRFLSQNAWKRVYFPWSGGSIFENLDFIGGFQFIEAINIGCNADDIDVLYSMRNLRHLILGEVSSKVDLNRLSQVAEIRTDWHSKLVDLEGAQNLKKLHLYKFQPKSKSFEVLNLPKQ